MLLVTLCIQAIFLVCRLVTTLRHDRCVQQTVLPQDFAAAQERREKNGKEKEKSGKKKRKERQWRDFIVEPKRHIGGGWEDGEKRGFGCGQ